VGRNEAVTRIPEAMASGMRVTASFLPTDERQGRVQDLRCFVPEEAS